jgi:hypothetical protein
MITPTTSPTHTPSKRDWLRGEIARRLEAEHRCAWMDTVYGCPHTANEQDWLAVRAIAATGGETHA